MKFLSLICSYVVFSLSAILVISWFVVGLLVVVVVGWCQN